MEVIKIAINSIKSNTIRTILTTLGIIIGISAVIALLSLGQGAQNSILSQVEGFGSNTVNLIPVRDFTSFSSTSGLEQLLNNKFSPEILNILDNEVKFREIESFAPQIEDNLEVSFESKISFESINGVTPELFEIRDLALTNGRAISSNDNLKNRKVAVLGSDTAVKLFGESDPVGKNIKIASNSYNVIGVIEKKNPQIDDGVFIPFNTASIFISGSKESNQIVVQAKSSDLVDQLAIKIEEELNEYYNVTDEDDDAPFAVVTSADILTLTQSITSIFTTLLASIAAISLLVGGIGIMNIMLVSVTERTKEIGLRKAVGAKESAIRIQFLTEAIILTLIGGVIGIALGIFFAIVIGALGNIPVVFSPSAILLATSVSILIGLVFGFYPAYQASRLDPIDALRYE